MRCQKHLRLGNQTVEQFSGCSRFGQTWLDQQPTDGFTYMIMRRCTFQARVAARDDEQMAIAQPRGQANGPGGEVRLQVADQGVGFFIADVTR
ncbi:MAG: hypothetical protein BWY63_01465 [Chloroflexi bacterium ADurb.Bin360]|nr:MAG: hypothetical protein BWY63_01465 [Chloroflexi bacterium ADurb.Bin360]